MDATLAPRPFPPPSDDSERHLEAVGPIAVLGAMVEQKRRSQPSFPAPSELATELDTSDADETQPRPRVSADSDAFLKAR